MKCFYYAFLGFFLAIIGGFGLVWLFQTFSAKVASNADEESKR